MTKDQQENKALSKATLLLMQEHAEQARVKAEVAYADANNYADQIASLLLSHEIGIWPGDIVRWDLRPGHEDILDKDIEITWIDARHKSWGGVYCDGMGRCSGGSGGIKDITLVKSC